MGMQITITHRCGTSRDFWAPSAGGYVRVVTARTPGTLGWQPTLSGGSTLTCGPSEESLRRAARRWIRSQVAGYPGTCACGDTDCDGVRASS